MPKATKKATKRSTAAATPPTCLRVPTFLGVHTLALSEELKLDNGALRLWTGAASHDDPTADAAAQLLQEQQRYRSGLIGKGGTNPLDARSEDLFSSTPASGNRVLGGPYLRAALRDDSETNMHVWLSGGSGRGDGLLDGAAAAGGVVHWLGPYRVHVLSSAICKTQAQPAPGVGGGDSLQDEAETLMVQLAVDKVAAGAPREEIASAALPAAEGDEVRLWLSTQAAAHACFSSGSSAVEQQVDGSTGEGEGEALEPLSVAGLGGSLPPLLPSPPQRSEADSVEVELHAAAHGSLQADGGFGCAAGAWAAELSLMSLGAHEAHVTLPLTPAAVGDVAVAQSVSLASGDDDDADEDALEGLGGSRAQRQAEARRLGEGLESLLGL